jgi:Delta3-Delta2-enoyl-CoA isomerase
MIALARHGPIHELRLDRPPANALDPGLIAALRRAVEAAPAAGARAMVLSGSPGIFSAGLDVPVLLPLDRAGIAAMWDGLYKLMRALATSPVPVIAAITGHSPAGGCVLALFCDARVMAEGDYKIGLNEVRVGIPMPPILHRALSRLVGPRQAERLCVGAELVGGEEAMYIGLVDELAPPEQVVARALARAEELLALPPAAMAITRRLARAGWAELFAGGLEHETEAMLDAWFSREAQSAMRALVERLAARRKG